jgi:uncharacterized protein (TIGR02271 family)
MAKTVVGLMDNHDQAQAVIRDLTSSCGCERSDIGLMTRGSAGEAATDVERDQHVAGAARGASAGAVFGGLLGLVASAASLTVPGLGPLLAAGPLASALGGAGIGLVAGGIIGGLTKLGVPEEEAHYYAEGVRRGGTLLTVHARDDAAAECAAEVMRRHVSTDIDERAAQWKQQGWSGRFEGIEGEQVEGEQVLPVVNEELAVGKREVSRGGVRVYTRVIEKPVEETVQLREERARVERRPVDRPVSAGDDVFKDKTIEVREMAEEPVVQKRGRVTEEVRVGKEVTQRQETIRDTVRTTEVRVEQQGSAGTGAATYGGRERRTSQMPYPGAERRTTYRKFTK